MNAPLEELVTLAPGLPRASHVQLRDPNDDLPPLPPPSDHSLEQIGRFLDELDCDALDLSLRLDVLDAIAKSLTPDKARSIVAPLATLAALRAALDDVRARAADHRLAHFVAADAPLGAYLKGLLQRASMTACAIETFAEGLRRGAPSRERLARDLAEAAAFRFSWLVESIRRDVGASRMGLGSAGQALRDFRASLERLFVATDRLDGGFV